MALIYIEQTTKQNYKLSAVMYKLNDAHIIKTFEQTKTMI